MIILHTVPYGSKLEAKIKHSKQAFDDFDDALTAGLDTVVALEDATFITVKLRYSLEEKRFVAKLVCPCRQTGCDSTVELYTEVK